MMNAINTTSPPRWLQIKIMYWGPGESGKTTNFLRLKDIFAAQAVSHPISVESTTHRTLWNDSITFSFDLFSLNLKVFVIVMTTTGQERFLSTREYVLQNADGVVFVADSHRSKQAENKRSFEELLAFTRENAIPILIQLNKQDLPNAISLEEFRLNLGLPTLETDRDGVKIIHTAIARNAAGVKEVFFELLQKVLMRRMIN
jgi:signal recognition particle receptor subunit beta